VNGPTRVILALNFGRLREKWRFERKHQMGKTSESKFCETPSLNNISTVRFLTCLRFHRGSRVLIFNDIDLDIQRRREESYWSR
jgi:hypothetical protein